MRSCDPRRRRDHRSQVGPGACLTEEARSFYLRFDFEPPHARPLHLMLLMKDIQASGWQR
jgi:hypothetical protein